MGVGDETVVKLSSRQTTDVETNNIIYNGSPKLCLFDSESDVSLVPIIVFDGLALLIHFC